MSETVVVGWERAMMAAERVKERLRRATRALDGAGVPYAVVGGNAVAEWVARIDDEAVRNTRNVDLLVRRGDFPPDRHSKRRALFTSTYSTSMCSSMVRKASLAGSTFFLPVKKSAARMRTRPRTRRIPAQGRVPGAVARCLRCYKLTAWRDKDRTHLRDMIQVGLLDATWPARLPPPLAERSRSCWIIRMGEVFRA